MKLSAKLRLIADSIKKAARQYMQVGDVIFLKNKNVTLTLVSVRMGHKYWNIEATDENGKRWWMRVNDTDYATNNHVKFLHKVRQKTLQEKIKPHNEFREKQYQQRSEGLEKAREFDLKPGDMVEVRWRRGPGDAQLVKIDYSSMRATVYNANRVLQTIPMRMITKKTRQKPFENINNLQEKADEKSQRRKNKIWQTKQRRNLFRDKYGL